MQSGTGVILRSPRPRASRRTLVALAGAASLSACAAVGPNFKPPAAPATSGYAMAGDTAPNLQHVALGEKVADDWWAAFRSPALDRVMRQAIADNPSLQAANATLASLEDELAAVRGQGLPQVDATAGLQYQRLNFQALGFNSAAFPGLSINNNPQFPLYSVGPSVTYAVDIWGGQRRAVEAAAAQAEAQARQAEAAYLTLTGDVATDAALIAALRAQIATVQSILADDQRNIALVQKAHAAGGVAEEARVNAAAQEGVDAALLPPLQQQLAVARHGMAVLVGRAPVDWTPPDFDLAALPLPKDIPVSLPSDLVHERPDILQAEADLHAATAEIGVATAKLYPSLNLTAAMTIGALEPQNLFQWSSVAYNVGAGLSAPIFHGGQLKARRQAAIDRASAAAATYRATVVKAFGQIADLLQALSTDEATLTADERQQATAQATLRLNTLAYQEGGGTLLPVVDAERQVNNARLAVVRAEAQRYLDTIQLFVATGHGWRRGTIKTAAR